MSTNNKISNLVYSQLPFFVRNDHPNFVAFMEAYYEYLEQDVGNNYNGKVIERGKNLQNYIDVDKTVEIFAENLFSQFLHLIPKNTLADRDKLIKRILDFYRARGTEKAARFLIKILFDEDLDFYYPKSDILKTSDGKWFIERSLNIEDVAVNNVANSDASTLDYFTQRMIYGATSNSTAAVDRVSRTIVDGTINDKLFLSYIKGRFLEGEKIYTKAPFGSNTVFLTANVSNNSVINIVITNKGSLYNIGDYVLIESGNSVNVPANAQVSLVSRGEIYELNLIKRGAGFQVGNQLEFIEDFGSNANGAIISVFDNNFYHPNSYNLISSTIQLEANTPLNNAKFSNLSTSIVSSPNANSVLSQVLNTIKISGLGPISEIRLNSMGSEYRSSPAVDAKSNTMLRELGILGKMDIVLPGSGYQVGDTLVFTNPLGVGYTGFGANGNVRNVSVTGGITEVQFTQYNNELIGGSGYIDSATLEPKYPDVTVVSATGSNAQIRVVALLGDGEKIHAANNSYGGIEKITINENGYNYIGIPTINLQSSGDGTAEGYAIMSTGYEVSEGRYLNDDGFISAFNFLQDRDYYQNYSYVMIVKQNLKDYRDIVKSLLHPVGMKLFGEYDFISQSTDVAVTPNVYISTTTIVQPLANVTDNIVTYGLKVYLDANNQASYSGSGTTWNNLTSVDLDADVTGLTYSNGYFTDFGAVGFDLSTTNKATIFNHGTSDFTYSYWLNFNSFSGMQTLFTLSGAPFGQVLIRLNDDTSIGYIGPTSSFGLNLPSSMVTNKWYNIALVRRSGVMYNYLNGIVGTNNAFTDNIVASSGYAAQVGAPFFAGQNIDGKCSIFSVYSRALNEAELIQNYKVLKGRFGA